MFKELPSVSGPTSYIEVHIHVYSEKCLDD